MLHNVFLLQKVLYASRVSISPVSLLSSPWQSSRAQSDSSLELSTQNPCSEHWIKAFCLYKTDKECLTSSVSWLNDSIISASLSLLKKEHPTVGGLQSTVLGTKLRFEVAKNDFVQVCMGNTLFYSLFMIFIFVDTTFQRKSLGHCYQ